MCLAGRLRSDIVVGSPVTIGGKAGGLTNTTLYWAVKNSFLSSHPPLSIMHIVRLPYLISQDFHIMGKTSHQIGVLPAEFLHEIWACRPESPTGPRKNEGHSPLTIRHPTRGHALTCEVMCVFHLGEFGTLSSSLCSSLLSRRE